MPQAIANRLPGSFPFLGVSGGATSGGARTGRCRTAGAAPYPRLVHPGVVGAPTGLGIRAKRSYSYRMRPTGSAIWLALASLRLTIGCLAALMVLVVACTLAQVEVGTWPAVDRFMRSWLVWWSVPGAALLLPVFPGGVLVGLLLGMNLLAAHLSRLQLTWRKAGLWIIHAGLVLLVAGEFVTGAFQQDMRMTIEEGQTVDFVESPRALELAVVDTTDPAVEEVHGIPASRLASGARIDVPGTPLAVQARRYLRNATFVRRAAAAPSLVTAGVGGDVEVIEQPPVTAEDRVNTAAAVVELAADGRSLGTWLTSNALASPQSFQHAGRTYVLALRPARQYLPYSLTLKDFRHDRYPGTDIPRNFSSLVRLSDRATGAGRDVLISMNQPLRHGGRAFYQASFGKGDRLSVLQVVENPGWLLPYAAALLVGTGLLVHFVLARRRPAGPQAAAAQAPAPPRPRRWGAAWLAPRLAGVLALGGALAGLAPPGAVRGLDLDAFGRVPVLEGGRLKPVDSVARNALLLLRGQQELRHDGRRVGADEWLLDVLFRPEVADAQPAFFVDDPEVLGLMGLAQGSGRYFPMRALLPHLKEIERQGEAARQVESGRRTRFQGAVANLLDRIQLYLRLRNTIERPGTGGLAAERADPGSAARWATLAELAAFRPLPPAAGRDPDAWRTTGEALAAAAAGGPDPALRAWALVSRAYRAGDGPAFDAAVAGLRRAVAAASPPAARQATREALFNRAQPFRAGMAIYVLAALVLLASWLWRPAVLRPTAFALLLVGALVHSAGLAARILLQGRPPVTNLYSSAVFVGWAAVVVGLLLERVHRRGFGTAVASASGFASLLVAHHLAGTGDTMEMMRAVLDSNFWLATHVVAITVGYSGTFLAGALALGYAVRRHLARSPDPAGTRALVSLTYGVLCFALFFSFVGTVLGGIWADQSWGRFWGWDPKENGALLIVLWNAVILHARLAGLVREQGLMAMAIVGNAVTSLSWFGVNMLGVGLHAYGFMDSALWPLAAFVASQLLLAALALVPRRLAAAAVAPVLRPEVRA
jgi:ABC-type transport system involved in cytochrome c biogenesis permease subunit